MKPLIVEDRSGSHTLTMKINAEDAHYLNPLVMTTGEIAKAMQWLEEHQAWHAEAGYTYIATRDRARLAALRAELIRRTN